MLHIVPRQVIATTRTQTFYAHIDTHTLTHARPTTETLEFSFVLELRQHTRYTSGLLTYVTCTYYSLRPTYHPLPMLPPTQNSPPQTWPLPPPPQPPKQLSQSQSRRIGPSDWLKWVQISYSMGVSCYWNSCRAIAWCYFVFLFIFSHSLFLFFLIAFFFGFTCDLRKPDAPERPQEAATLPSLTLELDKGSFE